MKRAARLFALLLALCATGCATNYTAHNVGYSRDTGQVYTAVYSDGTRLVATYTAFEEGAVVERWGEADLGGTHWVSLAALDKAGVKEYSAKTGAVRPARIEGLQKISLHGLAFPNPAFNQRLYGKSGVPTVVPGRIYSGEAHRQEADRLPFTAWFPNPAGRDGTLILIRDDPGRPGELQALKLAPDRDPAPVLRWATYPFAVAFDVITSPVQLVFYWAMTHYHE